MLKSLPSTTDLIQLPTQRPMLTKELQTRLNKEMTETQNVKKPLMIIKTEELPEI